MASSPTSRTLDRCRRWGWRTQVVERWNQYAKIRIDLFGIIDLIALTDDNRTIGIQATSTGNMSARVNKALEEKRDELLHWLRCDNEFQVWGFALRGKAGKRKLYKLKRKKIVLTDGEPVVHDLED